MPASKIVIQFDLDGNEVARFPSSGPAALAVGIDRSAIIKAATGKLKNAAGFNWRYVGDDRPFEEQETRYRIKKRIGANGDEKFYATITELREDGYEPQVVNMVCRGEKPSYSGYCWKFASEDDASKSGKTES